MRKFVIDTNALISFITDRNPPQQEAARSLFESAAQLKCLVICPQNVLNEFVFVMERVYGVKKDKINAILTDFISMPGIQVEDQIDYTLLLSLWPSAVSDFGDAIVASVCRATKASVVFTFDRNFITALKKAGLPAQTHP